MTKPENCGTGHCSCVECVVDSFANSAAPKCQISSANPRQTHCLRSQISRRIFGKPTRETSIHAGSQADRHGDC